MYDIMTIANTTVWYVYIWKLLTVNPKNSHHQKKFFFAFYKLYLYKIMGPT